MLIDINGDGLPDRVFDRNPKTDQQGLFVYLELKLMRTGKGSPGRHPPRAVHTMPVTMTRMELLIGRFLAI
jgi:hypothetical protein